MEKKRVTVQEFIDTLRCLPKDADVFPLLEAMVKEDTQEGFVAAIHAYLPLPKLDISDMLHHTPQTYAILK